MFEEKPSTRARGISRRSVVRAGANAAWMVPVVTVATATPAGANTTVVQGGSPNLAPTQMTASDADKKLTLTGGITNTGQADSGATTQMRLDLSNVSGAYGKRATATVTPTGNWTVAQNQDGYLLTHTGVISPNESVSFSLAIDLVDNESGSATVTPIVLGDDGNAGTPVTTTKAPDTRPSDLAFTSHKSGNPKGGSVTGTITNVGDGDAAAANRDVAIWFESPTGALASRTAARSTQADWTLQSGGSGTQASPYVLRYTGAINAFGGQSSVYGLRFDVPTNQNSGSASFLKASHNGTTIQIAGVTY